VPEPSLQLNRALVNVAEMGGMTERGREVIM
jgi:hypothetical protein